MKNKYLKWPNLMSVICFLPVLLLAFGFSVNAQDEGRSLSEFEAKFKAYKKVKHIKVYRASYDKFKDKTAVGATNVFIDQWTEPRGRGLFGPVLVSVRTIRCSVFFDFSGNYLKVAPQEFQFVVQASGGNGRPIFGEAPGLIFLADNERIDVGNGSRSVTSPPPTFFGDRGDNLENVFYSIDADTFKKLARAKNIEIQIGNREMKMKPGTIEVFANIFSLSQFD